MAPPFRFGVQAKGASTAVEWAELARTVEDLGYSTLTVPDHFYDQLAPCAALMAAADATTTLRVGTIVCCNDFRHPAVLAKEAATIDLLSDGRLELGVGAGWMASDYEQSGLDMDPAGIRIDRLVESIEVIVRLFGGEPVDYDGDHYRVRGLEGFPVPVQDPHPPLFIGAGGRRMLGVAGRFANIVGVNATLAGGTIAAADATPERFDEKVAWLESGAGERFDELELSTRAFVVSVSTAGPKRSVFEGPGGFEIGRADAERSPLALVGSPARICEELMARRERWGFSYIVIGAEAISEFAPVVAELTDQAAS